MKTANQDQTRFKCEGFQFLNDCKNKPNGLCTYSFRNCQNCKLTKCDGKPASNKQPASPQNPRIPPRPSNNRPTVPTKPSSNRRPVPTKDQKIDKVIVNMGPDGTDDNVKIKICSDDNTVCCESDKLSHLLKSEWVKDKKETWKAKEFGKCKNQVFKVNIFLI